MSLYNNELQKETIVTSFMGMERCDFLLYVAKIIRADGKNLLVIDNSVSKDFYNAVAVDTDMQVVDYRDITIAKNIAFTQEEFIKYDHVIIYHGMKVDEKLATISDYIYVFTNYEASITKMLKNELLKLPNESGKIKVIYRDKANSKIPEKVINSLLGLSEKSIQSQFVLPFDIKDYSLYLAFVHNGSQVIKNLSPDYSVVLETIVSDILGWQDQVNKKHMAKLIKKAR